MEILEELLEGYTCPECGGQVTAGVEDGQGVSYDGWLARPRCLSCGFAPEDAYDEFVPENPTFRVFHVGKFTGIQAHPDWIEPPEQIVLSRRPFSPEPQTWQFGFWGAIWQDAEFEVLGAEERLPNESDKGFRDRVHKKYARRP